MKHINCLSLFVFFTFFTLSSCLSRDTRNNLNTSKENKPSPRRTDLSKRNVLFFLAEYDSNNAFCQHKKLFKQLQNNFEALEQSSYYSWNIKITEDVTKPEDIFSVIESVEEKIAHIIIAGHGSQTHSLILKNNATGRFYINSVVKLGKLLRYKMEEAGTVLFDSCYGGLENGLAHNLSIYLPNRKIFGVPQPLPSGGLMIALDSDGSLSYSLDDINKTHILNLFVNGHIYPIFQE